MVLSLTIAWETPALAQRAESDRLSDLRASFRSLDYARVERLASSALETYDIYTPAEVAEIHRILALTYFYQGAAERAREQFEAALSIEPTADLDPLMIPPQAIAFYEQVRSSAENGAAAGPPPRYLLVTDPRPAAAVRSLLLPGWGQLYKSDVAKGSALLSAWVLTGGGAVAVHVARNQARESYERATEPVEIAERYDRYNRLHKVRNGLLIGAAAVWIYGALDALLTHSPSSAMRVSVGIAPGPGSAAVLQLRF